MNSNSKEIRRKILEILYQERLDPLQIFDDAQLINVLGISWDTIRAEVNYLEETGYIFSKNKNVGSRIFRQLRITAKGVDSIEEDPELLTISILFLSADPTDIVRLRIGEEVREIQEKLQMAKMREHFVLHQRSSVRPADISQAMLDIKPQIVHFSGHGTNTGALCFEDKSGNAFPISSEALAVLFEQFVDQVDCVILNACYSEIQAKAIAQHIRYVIGTNQAISDQAAIAFTIGFYQALGAGSSIENSYKLGRAQILLQGVDAEMMPILIKREELAQ